MHPQLCPDDIRSSFQLLASAVCLPKVDPFKFDGTFLSPSLTEPNRPNRETHPNVKFWDKSDYLKWQDSSEAQVANRGKLPYLEDDNGAPIPDAMVDAIRKTMRGAWSELLERKLAPMTWGKLTASGIQLMNSIMENAHPIFRLANNGWKLDYLAMSSYSSWRRNHLENGDGENSKKRKELTPVIKSEVPSKKIKSTFLIFVLEVADIMKLILPSLRLLCLHKLFF